MSELVLVTLIAGGLTLASGLAGAGAAYWFAERREDRQRAERERERAEDRQEWYGQHLFEERVRSTQEAYTWIMRLNRVMSGEPWTEESRTELRETALRARDWYDENVMWLHDGLPGRSEFVGLCNKAPMLARDDLPGDPGAWEQFIETERSIRQRAERLMGLAFDPIEPLRSPDDEGAGG